MPTYLFMDRAPQVGRIERFTLNHPGNVQQAVAYAKKRGLGGTHQHFDVYSADQFEGKPVVLCVQVCMGIEQNGQQVQLSGQHVAGGQPTGAPVGQPNQFQGAEHDPHSPFDKLPSSAMPIAQDAMFGEMNDPTQTDLVMGTGGMEEIPRQSPPPQ